MLGIPRPVLYGLAGLALAALVALGVGIAVASFRGALADAREEATKARDAHWEGEIAKHNARVADARLKAAEAALEADRTARAAEARESILQAELERANAALPDAGATGLSRERVCLLSPASCADGAGAARPAGRGAPPLR